MVSRHYTLFILMLVLLPVLACGGEPVDDLQPFYLTQKVARRLIERQERPRAITPTRQEIDQLIDAVATTYHLNPAFIHAVVRIESNYDAQARSHAGAMGLMQLMPQTARELGVKDPWDAKSNLDGGTRYLVALLREFGDAHQALVAYHAGPAVVREERDVPGVSRRYVRDVLGVFQRLRRVR